MSSDSTFLQLNSAALVAFCLTPNHNVHLMLGDSSSESDYFWFPDALGSKNPGVEIPEGAVALQMSVAISFLAGAKSFLYLLDETKFSSSRTYMVTINSIDYDTTAKTSAQAAIADLATQINDDSTTDTDPKARALATQFGDYWILHVYAYASTPSGSPTLTFAHSVDTGTGDDAASAGCDCTDAAFTLWVQDRGPTGGIWPDQWYVPVGGTFEITQNTTQRIDVAGYKAVAIQFTAAPTKVSGGTGTDAAILFRLNPGV